MRNPIIEKLLAKSRRTDIPKFGPGDTIKVQVKIREGEKERLQAFEGVVISRSEALNPALPSARSASARAWSVFSPSTQRSSTRLTWCGPAKSVAPSSTTCAG